MARHPHRIALAIALTVALIAAAPASAKFARALPSASDRSAPVSAMAPGVTSSAGQPTSGRAVASSDSSDWSDVGIGAGGALALTVLLFGTAVAVTHVRRRPTGGSATT